MPFTFPDPNVQTTVTAPNGEVWHYIDGAWTVATSPNNDQQQIDNLNLRVADIIDEVEENEESLEQVMPGLINAQTRIDELRIRMEDVEGLDLTNALSALALAQQDIIELKSKVSTLELTSFLILE